VDAHDPGENRVSLHQSAIIDLFAGPGGWSEGLRMLGHTETGIEWDDAACATARAAGHKRVQADVAALNPIDYPCWGLIASPPCQAWSMAGKGGGRRDVEHVIACSMEMAAGSDTRAEHAAKCEDARSLLVVEALRWAVDLEPTWIAFEQVPPVLELWSLYAQLLERRGYNVWTGVLEAERYGVPQTRERAILMAHRDRVVQPPRPTHQRYIPGEPQRHDVTFDGEVLPWVSMAQALGWEEGPSPAPSPSVTGGGGETGGVEVFASKAARSRAERAVGLDRRQGGAPVRAIDEPAHTMSSSGLSHGRDVWVHDRPAPTIVGTRRSKDGMLVGRQMAEGEGENVGGWGWERPSTTVNADPRIADPTLTHERRSCQINPATGKPYRQQDGAVRVTVQQAATLQSFRPDYPWQGTRTKQFQQIGNAVPPLLARAVLAELVDEVPMEAAA
jgi:DNA (cytosine-5)-methyltransferase 1